MSANNTITINKKTYLVKEVDAETGYGNVLGEGKNLEEAVEIVGKVMETEEVEYGIRFVKD